MSSQLVDINGDGHQDILVGSFSGIPQWIKGSAEGFHDPEPMVAKDGTTVLIADFWNQESEDWDSTDRAKSEGHCTSVAAVDWDADGDLDLLLGDYYDGRLYVRLNEGTANEPKFALTNEAVLLKKKPLVVEDGLAAPRVVDFDGDGLFDIICGGSKGGAYYYHNTGQSGSPKFETKVTLVEPVADPSHSYVRKVATVDDRPTMPGSSFHIDAVDYDGDGDLDLLVGARSSWDKAVVRKLTADEKKIKKQLEAELDEVHAKYDAIAENEETTADDSNDAQVGDETDPESAESAAAKDQPQPESLDQLEMKMIELHEKLEKYETDPVEEGDFVWLFRRK